MLASRGAFRFQPLNARQMGSQTSNHQRGPASLGWSGRSPGRCPGARGWCMHDPSMGREGGGVWRCIPHRGTRTDTSVQPAVPRRLSPWVRGGGRREGAGGRWGGEWPAACFHLDVMGCLHLPPPASPLCAGVMAARLQQRAQLGAAHPPPCFPRPDKEECLTTTAAAAA